ncbi:uncharacterized protein [Macrobrachium rosenbergii]|uniref:uncharacterized protein n=1 Tax=Macrobrachium rosenbergii TaxID=79674 RepID=UPI0034D65F0C
MPRKERRKKEQERCRQDAAKGSRTLYDWMKPRVAASISEQVEEDSEDREETQESEESETEDMEADDEPNEEDSVDDLEEQVAPQEPQIEARAEVTDVEEPFSMLPELQYPNDPAYASNALQLKDLDLAASYRIVDGVLQSLRELRNDEKFQEIFTKVKDRAESMAINLPSVIPGQGRRRKMPERYKYSATSATTEDQQYQTLDDYYRVRVFYEFLDKISQELQRRFKDGDNTTRGILKAFHYMTVQDNWKEPVNEEAFKSLQKLCQFYELEEVDKLQLELKIFIPHFLAIHRTLQLQCST